MTFCLAAGSVDIFGQLPFSITPVVVGILGLAVICLLLQIAAGFRYRRESGWIAKARGRLADAQSGQEVNLGIPRGTEAARRTEAVARISESGHPPRIADLSEAVICRDEATVSTRLSGAILSVLLILGVLGTLFNLKEVLGSSTEFIDEKGAFDVARLNRYVDDIHRGLKSAFVASLWGVGATVVLLFSRAFLVIGPRNRFAAKLDEFSEEVLIPRFFKPPPTTPRALLEASAHLNAASAHLNALVPQLAETVRGAAGSSVLLESFARTLSDTTKNLTVALAEDSPIERCVQAVRAALERQEKIQEEHGRQATADREAISKALAVVGAATQGSRDAQQTLREAVDSSSTQHRDAFQRLNATLGDFSSKTDNMLGFLQAEASERKSTLAKLLQELSRMLEHFAASSHDMLAMTEELRQIPAQHELSLAPITQQLVQNTATQSAAHAEMIEKIAALALFDKGLLEIPESIKQVTTAATDALLKFTQTRASSAPRPIDGELVAHQAKSIPNTAAGPDPIVRFPVRAPASNDELIQKPVQQSASIPSEARPPTERLSDDLISRRTAQKLTTPQIPLSPPPPKPKAGWWPFSKR